MAQTAVTRQFQEGRIYLPGLDNVVEFPTGYRIRNDGEVESIEEHTKKLYKEFNIPGRLVTTKDNPGSAHVHFVDPGMPIQRSEGSVMCFAPKIDSPWIRPFLHAREETAIMLNAGLIDQVKRIGQWFGYNLWYSTAPVEVVAAGVGLLVVERHGLRVDDSFYQTPGLFTTAQDYLNACRVQRQK